MSHRTVTPVLESQMPKPSGLLKRGSRYYTNVKVPRDVVDSLGKDKFFESLKISDYREACEKLRYRLGHYQAVIDETRRKLASVSKPRQLKAMRLIALTASEAFALATRYLVTHEERGRRWFDENRNHLSPEATKKNTCLELAYLKGEMPGYPLPDGTTETERFLRENGLECAPSSPAFQTLKSLVLSAHVEHLERFGDMVAGNAIQERDNRFRSIHACTPIIDDNSGATVEDLIENHRKRHELKNRKPKTKMAVRPAHRLLLETLGAKTPLASLKVEHMNKLFGVMREIPVNASTKYPGVTYSQAIEKAKAQGDTRRASANTNWATFPHIQSAFKAALEDEFLAKNLVNSSRYKDMFPKIAPKEKSQFSIDELNSPSRAPLFTGCENDGRAYSKSGSSLIRRGRFWVPLLALFHRMRTNEACQLYAEDVKTKDGIPFIAIRESLDDHEMTEKKVKTKKSIRNVPIHPELLKLGFLKFVEAGRKNPTSPRLFPEIKLGKTDYYSDAFSKWFIRFVKFSLEDCKASLHSFRHQFRDAARFAKLTEETVGNLAAWDDGSQDSRNHIRHYGKGVQYFTYLAEQLGKLKYPDLDLSHLYPENCHGITYTISLRE